MSLKELKLLYIVVTEISIMFDYFPVGNFNVEEAKNFEKPRDPH